MVGSACWRLLEQSGYTNLIGKTSNELDLRNQEDVANYFSREKPELVIDAAARVGGIWANNEFPFEFLMDNMLIQNNLISSSLNYGIKKFIFLGSSCIYPKNAPQPLIEEYLLTGPLEHSNQWYAIAKISGVKLVEALNKKHKKDYISLMPTNLYGPGDNYDLKTSHVLPALIRKFCNAKKNKSKEVNVWGSGKPYREFLHVDDLANAVLFSIENKLSDSIYNVGSGDEISIKNLSYMIKRIINFEGNISFDNSKLDGTPRKLLDSSKIKNLGWEKKISLEDGIKMTIENYLKC